MRLQGQSSAWTWLTALLFGVACTCRGSLVKVNVGLKVRRGQVAHLQQEDLQFHVPHEKDACKVEVVMNEPMTQRVGKLMPPVFDCHYLADEVKYVHHGCPLLKDDAVRLRLYRFTDTETYIEEFSLRVVILEPECSIIQLGPKSLTVADFYSLSDHLDHNAVSFHYERSSTLVCRIISTSQDTHLPAHGRLVTGESEGATNTGEQRSSLDDPMCNSRGCRTGLKRVQFSHIACDDWLLLGLRYQHTDPHSPDIDYITIRLELKDTRSGSIYKSEQAWIPVHIVGAQPNQPPKPFLMSTFILEVDEFILTPLSTATLDAEDRENPQKFLVFNITKPSAKGFVTHLSDHTRPVSSFTWLDLNDMLIGFQPPNSSQTQRHNYEVEVEVHDLFFKKSPPFKVQVSVRNADTNAPRVSWNMGLSLLEGQSRPIAWEQIQVVDNDNLDRVHIIVVDGLQHGRLTVKGEKGFMFAVSDIQAGFVRYHHDDSDSVKDFIIFRIADGHHQTQHKFPIKILPKDDSPPFLITNTLIEAREGQMALISGWSLQASDMDSSNDYILFNITRPPQAGVVMTIPGPGLTGYPISQFLQRDLSQSTIYYQHKEKHVFDDFFEVVLSDVHEPPNLSESQIVMVHVEPVLDQPIKEVPGSGPCLVIKETDVVHITRQQLHFSDQVSPDSGLTYTVTRPPFYTGPHHLRDAGRLFLVDSIPKFVKDSNAPVLRQFTQHAVNFMKVAFMPPVLDIGPYPQHVQLILSVTNPLGKTVTGICLNITVLPVDNQPPQVVSNTLAVDEGGESCLSLENTLISDLDSTEEVLQVQLHREPNHGALWLGDLQLKPGHVVTLQDLRSLKVRYKHDSSETTVDDIEFIATDGTNSVSFTQQIKVNPINDEIPILVAGLKPVLSCDEGQETVITSEFICATDADSDNSSLAFLVARQPKHGTVLRNGIQVDCFLQADVLAGSISYKHTGPEVELDPCHDTITFVISDEQSEDSVSDCGEGKPSSSLGRGRAQQADSLQVYDLQITVLPVNSQPPSLTTGDVFLVDEGGFAPITPSHLKASDVDTVLHELLVSLISPPQFGYIENVLPSPGFEKRNTGISIASFPYRDIMNGHINYVQSRHQRLEPTADHFTVSVSDGKHSSAHVEFYIVITPTNDEVPEFVTQNITVPEGEMKQLDATVFQAVDLDVPQNMLHFSVVKVPQHGSIISGIGNRWNPEATHQSIVMDFTMTDITNGLNLMYIHDDSEDVEDSFTIQLTDGKHLVQRLVAVKILPQNDEEPRVIRNEGLEVEPGQARLISSAALSARDIDTPSTEVIYIFKSVPTQGLLQLKEGEDWVALTAGRNCSQESVDMNLLRYLHRKQHDAQTQDSFTFYLLDGKNPSPPEHFHISVKYQEKRSISIFSKPVQVSRGDLVVLTTDVLFAEDGTDKPDEILYAITKPAASGHIGYVTTPSLAIATFSQMDVAAHRVAYKHDVLAGSATQTIQFVVSNGRSSQNGSLDIEVTAVDPGVPSSLSLNRGLPVPQGSTVTIDPDSLAMSVTDAPLCARTFVLQQPPLYGKLLLNGAALTTGSKFSQENIDALDVSYRHDGGQSLIDHFTFTSSDGTDGGVLCGQLHTAQVFFIIQVLPLGTVFPELVKLLPLWRSEPLGGGQHGIFVTSHELRARDAQGRDEELTFCVVRPPYFGHMKNVSTGGSVLKCFSQSELGKRALAYVINPDRKSLTDSLEFTVSDVWGNTGPTHRLEFQWSTVELAQPHYSVCEEQETVALDILRRGNLAESSFVTVKVQEVTAEAGKDFLINSAALIQFDPGVSKKIWRIEILQDELEEAEETLTVTLAEPSGAAIGSINKAQVAIMETDRECHQRPSQKVLPPIQQRTPPPRGDLGPHRENTFMLESGVEVTKKKIKVSASHRPITPSSISSDGDDTVYTYHGIMGVHFKAASTPPRKGRKGNQRLFSRSGQKLAPPAAIKSEPRRNKNKQRRKLNHLKKSH